jgi:hypothetical protein
MRKMYLAACLLTIAFLSVAGAEQADDPGEPGMITGVVLDAEGHPVQNVKLYVKARNQPQVGAVRYYLSNRFGAFRVPNLRPGDYDVLAVPDGSDAMLTRWKQRVRLPAANPVRRITISIRQVAAEKG